MKDELETEAETLRIEDEVPDRGTVIFEWDRRYSVVAYDANGGLLKEFMLYERNHNALFSLIDDCVNDPTMWE